jgi:DNA-binding NarL/FixJ family response regulator
MTMQKKTKILCVDDHDFLFEGLKSRLSLEKDLEVVGRLPSADTLLPECRRLQPDIVLLDIEMPGADPFEAAEDVKRQCPQTRVVFLSAYIRDHYIGAACKAGAWGYFSKSDETADIIAGLRRVLKGEFAMGPKVQSRAKPTAARSAEGAKPPQSKLDLLTAREQEVLRMIGRGMTRADIAKVLCRSAKTVDGHREKIMKKLDIRDRAELVRFAIREGLVEA